MAWILTPTGIPCMASNVTVSHPCVATSLRFVYGTRWNPFTVNLSPESLPDWKCFYSLKSYMWRYTGVHCCMYKFLCCFSMSKVTTTMYKRLASLISTKKLQPYSKTINWTRCLIGFALLKAIILCLRGARSSANQAVRSNVADCPMDLAICEGKI